MNKIFLGFITLIIISNLFLFLNKGEAAEDSILYSLFETSSGELIETSIKAIYYAEESAEKEMKKASEHFLGHEVSSIKNKDNIYLINIIKDEIIVEIKGIDIENKSKITIKATVYGQGKTLRDLEQFIQDYTKNKEAETKYYKYMKGKLRNMKVDEALESINSTLGKRGFDSVETIVMDNGYTSIAILDSNLFQDEIKINYSLCSYETSTYIFIGTPIIDEIY
ncbi:MAG: hypothetical protein ACI33K_03885 [Clostridiaceae bacterium]